MNESQETESSWVVDDQEEHGNTDECVLQSKEVLAQVKWKISAKVMENVIEQFRSTSKSVSLYKSIMLKFWTVWTNVPCNFFDIHSLVHHISINIRNMCAVLYQ